MPFSSDVLSLDVDGHVATLWLDRDAARNALGRAAWQDLPRAAAAVAESDARALVLAARGPYFTVGLDLKDLGGDLVGGFGGSAASPARANERRWQGVREMQAAVSSLAELPIPVIAAVHGYCLGGGVDLITACDIRLAAADAVFSIRETKMAIVADLGTLQRLPRIIGAGHVAELAFTGRDIDAEEAARIGLVNRVAGSTGSEVVAAATALAREIASNSPMAVRGTKAVLRANDGRTVDEGLEFVARWNTLYLQSHDLSEAITAFLEKRSPTFRGE